MTTSGSNIAPRLSLEWVDELFAGGPEAEVDAMLRGSAAQLSGIAV